VCLVREAGPKRRLCERPPLIENLTAGVQQPQSGCRATVFNHRRRLGNGAGERRREGETARHSMSNDLVDNEAELQARLEPRIRAALPLLPAKIKLEHYLHIRLGHRSLTLDGADLNKGTILGRYDVLVLVEDRPLILAELKAPDVPVTEDDVRQVLSYARVHQPLVPLVLVTNGRTTIHAFIADPSAPAPECRDLPQDADAARDRELEPPAPLAESVISKPCTGPCGLTKPLTEFSRDRRSSDGRQSRCKECNATYHAAHAAQRAEYQAKWYAANREKVIDHVKQSQQLRRELANVEEWAHKFVARFGDQQIPELLCADADGWREWLAGPLERQPDPLDRSAYQPPEIIPSPEWHNGPKAGIKLGSRTKKKRALESTAAGRAATQ
jgi:Type I restriction enzyme R protein N terminus (HSDR_N)